MISDEDASTYTAVFSPCERYRYSLTRTISGPCQLIPRITWVMLNPSTATAVKNDNTISRCIEFSRRWGASSLEVVNLFAYRATDPAEMKAQADPIGPWNDTAIIEAAERATYIVAAWGAHGSHAARDKQVAELLRAFDVRVIGFTKDGSPKHPLARGKSFVPYDVKLQALARDERGYHQS